MMKRTSSIITLIIALFCMAVYLAALTYGALRVYLNVTERRNIAEREFGELAQLASSAGAVSFMDDQFKGTIQDALGKSRTLQALIISGPLGEFTFEKEQGKLISWEGDAPRFVRKFGVSSQALFAPLPIEGQRNVALSGVSQVIDYEYFIVILKESLLAVVGALVLAFLTLILESALPKKAPVHAPAREAPKAREPFFKKREPRYSPADEEEDEILNENIFSDVEEPEEKPPLREPQSRAGAGDRPQGLYSPRSNIGWEAYTQDRLESELHRCASFEQDLTVIVMEYRNPGPDADKLYRELADAAVNYFNLRDLIFERGDRGITVIYPNIDLDQGLSRAEEFHSRLPLSLTNITDLYVGLSSRAGRLVTAERLAFEASQALTRASKDPLSPIVAFKSDPEKYRAFIASQKNRGL
ncbi:MAG: hypothetical protein LBD08_06940 [Treponema sp.]|jgi:hypothetical protein|nr:hypothetical protein [Treponema sp.]